MSLLVEKEIVCTNCKHPNTAEVWSIVNVKEDPELKDILLGGEMNMTQCAGCRGIYYAEHFLIYHDPARELMAFVYPYSNRDEKEKWEKKSIEDFQSLKSTSDIAEKMTYLPISFFGLDELVQYVEKDENIQIQSDIVTAIAKNKNLSIRNITPYLARKNDLPYVLPYEKNGEKDFRASVLKGLKVIKDENDRLTVFSDALKKIEDNPTVDINLG